MYEGKNNDVLSFQNTKNYAYLQRGNLKDDFGLSRMKDDKNEWYLLIDGAYCVGASCIQDENIISVVVPKDLKYQAMNLLKKKLESINTIKMQILKSLITL